MSTIKLIDRASRSISRRVRLPLVLPIAVFVVALCGAMIALEERGFRAQSGRQLDQRSKVAQRELTHEEDKLRASHETFARLLADTPGLTLAVARSDGAGLRRLLEPLQRAQSGAFEEITVYARDGSQVLHLGPDKGDRIDATLFASALQGSTTSRAEVDAAGFVGLAATPIARGDRSVGALIVASTLNGRELALLNRQEGGELAFFQNGSLAAASTRRPAVISALRRARLDRPGIERLNRALDDFQLHASVATRVEGGQRVMLVSNADLSAFARQRTIVLLGAGALLLLSLPLIWLFVSRSVVRPLRAMATATKSMASGDYTRRIAPSRIPELATLGMGVNHLAERVEAQIRDLSHQAFHDALTGLPNRALFLDRLEHALARARRQGPSVVIIFLDLDNFKVLNDTLGHNVADELLIAVGERLRGALRGPDTLARLGGDEFTALLEDAVGLEDALGAVQRIRATLEEPIAVGGKELFTTASMGITIGASGSEAEVLVREADLAMYRAKANGKNGYEVFDATMSAQLEARLGFETDLRRALERNEFRLQYQPIIDFPSGVVDGVEALVRWNHPQRGVVAPLDFIPLAEQTGLVVPLGGWVLTTACRQASEWQALTVDPLTVSVNLSARQFKDGNLPSEVAQALRASGLDPSLLKLEVTETALIEDAEATLAQMNSIRQLGVEFVIDDFGVGYSALSYVKRFPFDEVKIDKTFVDGLAAGSAEDSAIVEAVASFARALGLRVTGEGIEDERQAALLIDLGCDHGQGYLFSRPLSPGDMAGFLAQQRAHALTSAATTGAAQ